MSTFIPVAPIEISGSFKLLPTHTLLIKSGAIHIKVGNPIPVDTYTVERKQELMDKVRSEIEGLGKGDNAAV